MQDKEGFGIVSSDGEVAAIEGAETRPARVLRRLLDDPAALAVGFGIVIFLAALFGIATRTVGNGSLATFWPANAIMLGLLLRMRSLRTVTAIVSATAGFLLADLITGSDMEKTMVLTAGNLVSVGTGYVAMTMLFRGKVTLESGPDVLRMFFGSLGAACGAALAGAVISPILFDRSVEDGMRSWFSTELACYVGMLPLILSFRFRRRKSDVVIGLWQDFRDAAIEMAPSFALLVVASAVGVAVGGIAALGLPLPALLWSAFRGNVFETSLLSALWIGWGMIGAVNGLFGEATSSLAELSLVESLQVGLAMAALAPVASAATIHSRNKLMRELELAATRDDLTGLLARGTFLNELEATLEDMRHEGRPTSLLLADVDSFKQINDRYGHPVGDAILVALADAMRSELRATDLPGRIGGDEFAAVLADCGPETAGRVAERIRAAFISRSHDDRLGVDGATASIGIATSEESDISPADLIVEADGALYAAKKAGRNCTSAVTHHSEL